MNSTISNNLNATDNYKFSLSAVLILTLCGLVGNLSAIYIIRRPAFRNISLYHYTIVSTTTETISLTFVWVNGFPGSFNINTNYINCKLFGYFSNSFLQMGPWINVISSIDRYFSVKYPFEFEFRNNFKFQAIVASSLILVIFLINIPFLFYLNTFQNEMGCGNIDYVSGLRLIVLEGCMQVIIPTIIILVSNSLTAYQLVLSKKTLRRAKFDKEFQCAKFSFSLNFFYIVFNLPYTVFYIYNYISKIYLLNNSFGYTVVVFLQKFYYSSLFLIYFLISKQFRKTALPYIYCKNRIEPIVEVAPIQMVAIRRD